jgi:hypothetical protein
MRSGRATFGRDGEEGTAVIELALSLFWIVFAAMFLIGLGHTLMNKQQALVGARFGAFHESGTGRAPAASQMKAAVSSRESWGLTRGTRGDGGEASGVAEGGIVGAAFNSLMGFIGRQGMITHTAETTPTRGILPRMMTVRASERYTLANDTWTCEKSGSYFSILTRSIGVPGLPFSISCCKTYKGR